MTVKNTPWSTGITVYLLNMLLSQVYWLTTQDYHDVDSQFPVCNQLLYMYMRKIRILFYVNKVICVYDN